MTNSADPCCPATCGCKMGGMTQARGKWVRFVISLLKLLFGRTCLQTPYCAITVPCQWVSCRVKTGRPRVLHTRG